MIPEPEQCGKSLRPSRDNLWPEPFVAGTMWPEPVPEQKNVPEKKAS